MISVRTLAMSIFCVALLSSVGTALDLSKYRDFEFGMNIESVAKVAHGDPFAAKTVHQRPQMIQTLDWQLHRYFDTSPTADSVQGIRFNFYNGELFKMVVTYDPAATKGMTSDDLIEALSDMYGPATKPETRIVVSTFQTYDDTEPVLARWENAEYSYNLFRSSYGSFGLVAFSKKLDLLATAANLEADRLDKLEAPAREIARQKKQQDDEQALQDKARLTNKSTFRP
jgi:hypothetical protein